MKKRIIRNILWVVMVFLLAEGLFRLQQILGPISDLEFKDASLGAMSQTLNHVNLPGTWKEHLEVDGFRHIPLTYHFDENGIRKNHLRPSPAENANALKILFMGDSFMHGYNDKDTIPQKIWEYYQGTLHVEYPLEFLNAGASSYSPAIFVPQAKRLIPLLRPDLVVVDVDETDLADDFIRYRALIERNSKDSIIAVKASPIQDYHVTQYLRIKESPSYILRYILKLWHRNVEMPRVIRKYRKMDHWNPLQIPADTSPDAKIKHKEAIAFFEDTVSDLAETLIRLLGDKKKILFLHHPHLQHIVPDKNGRYWNNFVAQTLRKVCLKYGITFYDATKDLKKAFGEKPQKYYWPGDMHYNYEGQRLYALEIAKQLLRKIESLETTPPE